MVLISAIHARWPVVVHKVYASWSTVVSPLSMILLTMDCSLPNVDSVDVIKSYAARCRWQRPQQQLFDQPESAKEVSYIHNNNEPTITAAQPAHDALPCLPMSTVTASISVEIGCAINGYVSFSLRILIIIDWIVFSLVFFLFFLSIVVVAVIAIAIAVVTHPRRWHYCRTHEECKQYEDAKFETYWSGGLNDKPVMQRVVRCKMSTIPFVVGGETATPNEFPHMVKNKRKANELLTKAPIFMSFNCSPSIVYLHLEFFFSLFRIGGYRLRANFPVGNYVGLWRITN